MKKTLGFLMCMLLVLSMPLALAQEEVIEDDAGVTPDSVFYGLDKAFDRVSLALTFGKAAKAEKGLKIAQERLMEAKEMGEKGKPEQALKAQEEHAKSIEKAKKSVEEIETDDEPEKAKETMKKVAVLQNKIESHYQKVTEVKDTILERQRERMSDEQIAKLEQVFNKIKAKAEEMETKLNLKKENAKTKYKALAKKTDAEVEAEEEEIDEEVGLVEGRQERAQKEIKKAEVALTKAKEKVKEEKSKGTDVEEIEQEIEEIEQQIENAKATKTQGNNKAAREIAEELKDFGNEVSALATTLKDAREESNFDEVLAHMKETIKQRHLEKMTTVLEKVPEQAKKSIQKVIEISQQAKKSVQKVIETSQKKENGKESVKKEIDASQKGGLTQTQGNQGQNGK